MDASPYQRRPLIDWEVVLLSTVLNLVVLPVLAIPDAAPVTRLLELAHRIDGRVPALAYGAVWALIYAAGVVRAFMRNHALVDGNKRLAWLAAVVFLDLNGQTVDLDDDAAFELVMAAAVGHLDVEQIAQRLVTGPN